jgi:hypothetical protein
LPRLLHRLPRARRLAKGGRDLDLLSDGRLELGSEPVGALTSIPLWVDLDRPGRRITKLEEVIALIKAHCLGEELAASAVRQRSRLRRSAPAGTAPSSSDHGRRRWRRVLTLAAREADIVSISNVPSSRNDAGLDPTRRRNGERDTCVRRQRIVSELESRVRVFRPNHRDPIRAGDLAAKTGIAEEILRGHPNVLIGSVDTVVDVLQSRRDELGINCHRPAATGRSLRRRCHARGR